MPGVPLDSVPVFQFINVRKPNKVTIRVEPGGTHQLEKMQQGFYCSDGTRRNRQDSSYSARYYHAPNRLTIFYVQIEHRLLAVPPPSPEHERGGSQGSRAFCWRSCITHSGYGGFATRTTSTPLGLPPSDGIRAGELLKATKPKNPLKQRRSYPAEA